MEVVDLEVQSMPYSDSKSKSKSDIDKIKTIDQRRSSEKNVAVRISFFNLRLNFKYRLICAASTN